MRKLFFILLCCGFLAVPALPNSVTVSFSTASAGPFSFAADQFSLAGLSGFLVLDTQSLVEVNLVNASFFLGDSGSFSGSENFVATYNLTVDGVTQTVSQLVNWTIAPDMDFLQVNGSNVVFETPAGNWNVQLNGYTFQGTPADIGTTQSVPRGGGFQPFSVVPEPGALALLSLGLLMLGLLSRKPGQRQVRHSPTNQE